jgi:hypothetical protein
MLRQNGCLPEQCRILKTWTTARGEKAYLLETLGGEEKVTVVQKPGAKPGAMEVAAQLYRWGNEVLPPKGSPIPPPDAAEGIRPVSHATMLPDLQPAPVIVPVKAPVQVPTPAPVAGSNSAGREKDKTLGESARRPEKPAVQKVEPGDIRPSSATGYGYYPTQWRPWPGTTESPTPPVSAR